MRFAPFAEMSSATLPGALNPFGKGFKNPKTFYYGFAILIEKVPRFV